MKKHELTTKTDAVIGGTKKALQTVFDALNKGQKKKILNNETVKVLFDRYGVDTTI